MANEIQLDPQALRSSFDNRAGFELDTRIDANYSFAQNYFEQKKKNSLLMFAQQQQSEFNNFVNELTSVINETIKPIAEKIQKEVINKLNIDSKSFGTSYSLKNLSQRIDFSDDKEYQKLADEINSYLDDSNKGKSKSIYAIIGTHYETILLNSLKEKVKSLTEVTCQNLLLDFINSINHTGSITGNSALRGNGLSIRPDWGNFDKTVDVKTIELQQSFNIETAQLNDESWILSSYLHNNKFGFSLKAWNTSDFSGKEITSASGMKDILNNVYSQEQKLAWNSFYVYRIMLLMISQHLLDLLGPTNIAIITKQSNDNANNVYWMHDLLKQYWLTMHVYTSSRTNAINVLKPSVESGNIYLQKQGIGLMSPSLVKRGKWKYVSIKSKIITK